MIRPLIRENAGMGFADAFRQIYGDIILEAAQMPSTCLNSDDIDLMIDYFAGGSYYLVRRWLLEDMKKTPEEWGGDVRKHFKRGSA